MRRVLTAAVWAVLVTTVWILPCFANPPATAKGDCIPVCHTETINGVTKKICVCGDVIQTTEPDSTTVLLAMTPDKIWGLAVGFPHAFTLGVHPWGDKVDSWMENSLEKAHTTPAPKEGGATILSVRVTRAKADVFESGYAVSVTSPAHHPTFRVSVLKKGKTVWTAGKKPPGNLIVADEWPRFASAGIKNGVPIAGWAYLEPQAIRIPGGSRAKMDTTVTGDQVRVALEGSKGPSSGILRLHCSPGIDSLKVQSFREGLFNLAIKK